MVAGASFASAPDGARVPPPGARRCRQAGAAAEAHRQSGRTRRSSCGAACAPDAPIDLRRSEATPPPCPPRRDSRTPPAPRRWVGAAPRRWAGAAPRRWAGAAPRRWVGAAPRRWAGAAPRRWVGAAPRRCLRWAARSVADDCGRRRCQPGARPGVCGERRRGDRAERSRARRRGRGERDAARPDACRAASLVDHRRGPGWRPAVAGDRPGRAAGHTARCRPARHRGGRAPRLAAGGAGLARGPASRGAAPTPRARARARRRGRRRRRRRRSGPGAATRRIRVAGRNRPRGRTRGRPRRADPLLPLRRGRPARRPRRRLEPRHRAARRRGPRPHRVRGVRQR